LLTNLPTKILLQRILFVAVVITCLVVGSISLLNAIKWIDKPFAGFLYYKIPNVGSTGNYQWPGVQAGLQYRDVILEVNGQKIFTGDDIQAIVSRTPVGEKLTYLLDRRGEEIRVSIPVSVFTLQDFFTTFGALYFTGVVFWIFGTIVYVLKPDTSTAWAFLLLCLFLGTYIATGFDSQSTTSTWWYQFTLLVMALVPPAFLHLSLVFPERTALIQRWPGIPLILYGLSIVSSAICAYYVVLLTNQSLASDEIILYSSFVLETIYFNRVYLLLGVLAVVASAIYAYVRSSSKLTKQRARVVLLGSGMAFVLPASLLFIVALGKLATPFNVFVPTVSIFPASIGFAIARHNLFDVDVYVKRTVGYIIMIAIVGLAYFLVQTTLSTFVLKPAFGAQAENIYPLVFALLVVFFFNPVNQRVIEAVDKLFFRKSYDYKATVGSMSDALSGLMDLDSFFNKMIQIVRTAMFIDRAGVLVLDTRTGECQSVFLGDTPEQARESVNDACPATEAPLLTLLAKEKKLITKYDIVEDRQYADVKEPCAQQFAELGASVALPLFCGDEFTGFLALGYKKSGHFYTRDDIDLLKTVSSMTSTAIEQAREKGQRNMLMQMFSKHVSSEVAESLWEQRDQFLEGGRPRTQKLTVTVMFTDLQGFTSVSEKMDPQVLMDWLNTYMESITMTVMKHGGVVDNYIGDGVMINFGFPVPSVTEAEINQDAVHAVNCALNLEEEMVRLNALMQEQALPTLKLRVGLYTGPVIAGTLGSAERLKYTTLGDTVNTASRLESFGKNLTDSNLSSSPCCILIGESTLRRLGNLFVTSHVGEISLKGKQEKINAYQVLGKTASVSTDVLSSDEHLAKE
jgi:class 3 adenylate cyclase